MIYRYVSQNIDTITGTDVWSKIILLRDLVKLQEIK